MDEIGGKARGHVLQIGRDGRIRSTLLFISRQANSRTQGRVRRMETREAIDLIRQALFLAMIVSAPMLLIGLIVGIFVSLLQAVTQIQEQTLTFVPKIA